MNSEFTEIPKIAHGEDDSPPLVKIQKIGQCANPLSGTAEWQDYVPGSDANTESPPEGYVVLGWLLEPIRVGGPVKLLRVERNGVAALGIFETTLVTSITTGGFETENSVYRLDWMPSSQSANVSHSEAASHDPGTT